MAWKPTRGRDGETTGGGCRQAERRSLFRRIVAVRALTREGEDPWPGGRIGRAGLERTLP